MEEVTAVIRNRDEGYSVHDSLKSLVGIVDHVVFIDNNSSDNSVREARKIKPDFESVRIETYNQTLAEDDNLSDINRYALSLADSEWILK